MTRDEPANGSLNQHENGEKEKSSSEKVSHYLKATEELVTACRYLLCDDSVYVRVSYGI